MIRCLILVVVVGVAWSRTLDGVAKDNPVRDRPHGIEGDYSGGNIDLSCEDCDKGLNKDDKDLSLTSDPNRAHEASSREPQRDDPSHERNHDHTRNHHRKRSKSHIEKILKPFLSISRVKVSVTRNGRRQSSRRRPVENQRTRHSPNQREKSGEGGERIAKDGQPVLNTPFELQRERNPHSQSDKEERDIEKNKVHLSAANIQADGDTIKPIVETTRDVGGEVSVSEHNSPTERKHSDESVDKTADMRESLTIVKDDVIKSDTVSDSLILKGINEKKLKSENKDVDERVEATLKVKSKNLRRDKYIEKEQGNSRQGNGKEMPDKTNERSIGDNERTDGRGKDNKPEVNDEENGKPLRKDQRNGHRKAHRKSHRHNNEDKTDPVDMNDGSLIETDNNEQAKAQKKKSLNRKRVRNKKTRSRARSRSGSDKSVGVDQHYDKELSDPIKLRTGPQGDNRWNSAGLAQVPDVERLERRLHPKVEAPVDDIIMALRRILHQMQHYIYMADYNYRHTFNSTRWEIMEGVREELLNIAKENDHVYDAVMEVSLHTKELYLRGHQRRRFNEAQATSSLPLTQKNGVRNLYLRSKYEYARDELRYAEKLKRKIQNLQRKRSYLKYDYMELTRKISEKLPTQALYDLGRRANQTMHILDYSRTMRDAMDRTRLYGHSHNSTFLDMRSARNHINDAEDIIVAMKQQYLENHIKAKEIKRARQSARVDSVDVGFDMNHVMQWATVDRVKQHADDLFNTAAMILMKFKPLLKVADEVIDATKKGTQESKFERTIRNIREQMMLLNDTMVSIRGDVCTDQYEVCIPKKEREIITDTDEELIDESSGDSNEEIDESSGGGPVEVTSTSTPMNTTTTTVLTTTPTTTTTTEAESKGWFWNSGPESEESEETTTKTKENVDESTSLLPDTQPTTQLEERMETTKVSLPNTNDANAITTTMTKESTTKPSLETEVKTTKPIEKKDTTTQPLTYTEDIDFIDVSSGDGPELPANVNFGSDSSNATHVSPDNNKKHKKKTAILLSNTDDEDLIEEIKEAKETTQSVTKTSSRSPHPTPTSIPLNPKTTQAKEEGSEVSFVDNDKHKKKPTILLTDSDDEDIMEEIKRENKAKTKAPKTPELTTTPVPKDTTTEAEEDGEGWFWLKDSFGFLQDQVWGANTRHKRETDEDISELSNITLSELIQEHLKNRSKINEEVLSQAKQRVQSIKDLQDYFNKVKSQIDKFENETLTTKAFTMKWEAESAMFRAVHDRVVDVAKDIDFKHSVFMEQSVKSVKKSESKLKRMKEAYEANKDRVTDNSGPEIAAEAMELAQTVKDNIGAIKSLKQLNPTPCKTLQTMDNMIRANISELRHKIKQAKLLAASLQVAVTMEGNSHLEIPVASMVATKKSSTKVKMTLKSYSGNGAIALVQTNDTGAIMVSLDDFIPKVTLLDDGQYNIEEKSGDTPLHNNTWYTFTLERFATDYNLTVYNSTSVVQSFITQVDSDDYPGIYNPPNSVFIGGATDNYDVDNWNGCIGDISVNGQFVAVLKADNKRVVPKSCTVLSNKMESKRSLVLDGFGYAFYELDTRQQRSRVSVFDVNFTAQSDGIVFTMNAETNRYHAMAAVKGRNLLLTIRHHRLKSDFMSTNDVIGTEQRIEIVSDGRSISVLLNGREDLLTSTTHNVELITSKKIGVVLGASSNTSRSIRGCIHGISLNNLNIPLNSMSYAVSVTYGNCEENHCLTFNTSKPIKLDNLTDADHIVFVYSYGSRGGIMQYSKGEKFHVNILIDDNGLDIIETVKDKSDTVDISDSEFSEGDDVVVMVTDKDKTLTVTVGEESASFSYGSSGGFWFLASDDDDDDGADLTYNITIGSTMTSDEKLQGNIVTLKINNRNVDLLPYLTPNKLQRCALPKIENNTKAALEEHKERHELTC